MHRNKFPSNANNWTASACRPVAGDAAAVAAAAVKATGERDNHLSDSPINTHLLLLLLCFFFFLLVRCSSVCVNTIDEFCVLQEEAVHAAVDDCIKWWWWSLAAIRSCGSRRQADAGEVAAVLLQHHQQVAARLQPWSRHMVPEILSKIVGTFYDDLSPIEVILSVNLWGKKNRSTNSNWVVVKLILLQ